MKAQLKILVPLFFVITVALAGWFGLNQIELEYKKNINDSLQGVLQTTFEALSLWQSNRLDELAKIAARPDLIESVSEMTEVWQNNREEFLDSSALLEFRDLMLSMIRKDDKGVFVITPDRISLASMRDNNIGTQNLINRQRKEHLDRVFAGETLFIPAIYSDVPLYGKSGKLEKKLPTMFIATPVRNEIGEIIAALTIRLDPFSDFSRITSLGRIGETGETYAFDETARLITESRFRNDLIQLGMIDQDEDEILRVRITDPGGNLLEGFVPKPASERPLTLMAGQAISRNNERYLGVYRDYRGVDVFGAWKWNEEMGFGLATEIDADNALKPFERTKITVILVLGVTVVMSLVLTVLLVRVEQNSRQELQLAYSDLKEAKEKAEIANLEKSRFLANMSHELRTPMHAILSFSNLALKRVQEEKSRRFLSNIKESGTRLTLLLDNLLDLSKLEAGKMDTAFVESNLTELIKKSINELKSLASEKHIELSFLQDEAITGEFDKKLIHQVMINLLSNAIKFSPANSVIDVSVRQASKLLHDVQQQVLEVVITDQGIGIPEDEIEAVFDKFTQSSKTKSKAGGTGLGLPICQEIVHVHQGDIWAVSPPPGQEVGTTMTFIIPVSQKKA